jgi:hypothetical protein
MTESVPIQKSASQSLTLKSAAAIAIALVASKFSIHLPDGLAQSLASAAIDLVSTLGLLGVAIGRVRARTPIA